jgi:hypothetical protein
LIALFYLAMEKVHEDFEISRADFRDNGMRFLVEIPA